MNIEPGILLMVHSISKCVDMTNPLLEFLFLLIENYDLIRCDLNLEGFTASIDILVGKGVVRSLESLSSCSLLSAPLREKLNISFPSYCKPNSGEVPRLFRPDLSLTDGIHTGKRIGVGTDAPAGGYVHASLNVALGSEVSVVSMDERAGALEALVSEVQSLADGLSEAMTQSNEGAAIALEKLLPSLISASNQMQSGNFAKSKTPNSSEINQDSTVENHELGLFSSSSLTVQNFATQVLQIIIKGGYEIFGPLNILPSEDPDGEKSSSLTSTLLHMYMTSNHPRMRQLLVAWHREELAVGPRVLCYISRLAEGVEPFLSRDFGLTVVIGDSEVDKLGKVSEEGVLKNSSGSNRRNTVIDGNENVICKSEDSSQDHLKNGGSLSVRTGNHDTNTSLEVNFRKLHSTNFGLQISIINAFKVYEDSLEQLCGSNRSSRSGGLNVALSHKFKVSTSLSFENSTSLPLESKRSVSGDMQKLDPKTPDTFLIKDLETCFMWGMPRISKISPLVFRYLPHLATGNEAMLLPLVSTVDLVDLSNFEYWTTVGELAVMGREMDSLACVVKASLNWDSFEQHSFWRLMGAKILSLSPAPVIESQAPTVVLSLPPKFGSFVAIVMTAGKGEWCNDGTTS